MEGVSIDIGRVEVVSHDYTIFKINKISLVNLENRVILSVAHSDYGRARILFCALQSTVKSVRSERFVPFGSITSIAIHPR